TALCTRAAKPHEPVVIRQSLLDAPQSFKAKFNLGDNTKDAVYIDAERRFQELEKETKKLHDESKKYFEAINGMLTHQIEFSKAIAEIYKPISGRVSDPSSLVIEGNPEGIKACEEYEAIVQDLLATLQPELEMIETRVIKPADELLEVIKVIRKTATKRAHKQLDYDRHRATLKKLQDKKEKSLKDEKAMYKAENDVERSGIAGRLGAGSKPAAIEAGKSTYSPRRSTLNSSEENAPPPYSPGSAAIVPADQKSPAWGSAAKAKGPAPPPPKPKPSRFSGAPAVETVTALYDYEAQADGDLSFSTGDVIEIVTRTANENEWWTGKLKGRQGQFPALPNVTSGSGKRQLHTWEGYTGEAAAISITGKKAGTRSDRSEEFLLVIINMYLPIHRFGIHRLNLRYMPKNQAPRIPKCLAIASIAVFYI
ncbi:hypothetical protein DH86_00003114, partial [Scytalidium sp. 3C]